MQILGDTPNLSNFHLFSVKLNTVSSHNFRNFLFPCSLNIELDVDSFGLRRDVDDSEVVSVIVSSPEPKAHG